jgi:hypothetical protein
LSLLAFAAVSLSGAVGGDDFDGTIRAALVAGAVFAGLGFVLGDVARRAVEEQVESEFNRWMAEHRDALNRSNQTTSETPSGPENGSAHRADRTNRTQQSNQPEPRTGAAQAASKPSAASRPTGQPAAGRGRA